MILKADNIIKLFIFDTYICAVNEVDLMTYQTNKHGWDFDQWNAYFQEYRIYMTKLCDDDYTFSL